MDLQRTVGRSQTAGRPASRFFQDRDEEMAPSKPGVELVGLGCDLEEWDRIAATMPAHLRPSVRGAWSEAFARAAHAYRLAPPTPAQGARAKRAQGSTLEQRTAEVQAALAAHGPLTITELAGRVGRSYQTVYKTVMGLKYDGVLTSRSVIEQGPHHLWPHRVLRFHLATPAREVRA